MMLKMSKKLASRRMSRLTAAFLAMALFNAAVVPALAQEPSAKRLLVDERSSGSGPGANQRAKPFWQRFSLQLTVDAAEERWQGIGSLAINPVGGVEAVIVLVSPADLSGEEFDQIVEFFLPERFLNIAFENLPAGETGSGDLPGSVRLLRLSGSISIQNDGTGKLVLGEHTLQVTIPEEFPANPSERISGAGAGAQDAGRTRTPARGGFVFGGLALGGVALGRATPFAPDGEILSRIQSRRAADAEGEPRSGEWLVQLTSLRDGSTASKVIGTVVFDAEGNVIGGRLTAFDVAERTLNAVGGSLDTRVVLETSKGAFVGPGLAFALVQLEDDSSSGQGASAALDLRLAIMAPACSTIRALSCLTGESDALAMFVEFVPGIDRFRPMLGFLGYVESGFQGGGDQGRKGHYAALAPDSVSRCSRAPAVSAKAPASKPFK